MATVTVSLPADGDTIDAGDYNTPITTIVNEFNGNIDSTNIKAGGVTNTALAAESVSNSKLNTTAGDIGGVWKDWTPSWTNLTVGAGTVVAKYCQVGKNVFWRLTFTFGVGSSVGAAIFSLPVTSATLPLYTPIGQTFILDSGTATYNGQVIALTSTTAKIYINKSDGVYLTQADPSSSIPMTWATNDQFIMSGNYEAA